MGKKSATRRKGTKMSDQGTSESPANEPHSIEPSSLTVAAKRQPGRPKRGTGLAAAGQSGALQGLHRDPDADSQSVEELVEEGQTHEAEVVSAIENAPDPDQGEVHTHRLPGRRNSSRGGDEE